MRKKIIEVSSLEDIMNRLFRYYVMLYDLTDCVAPEDAPDNVKAAMAALDRVILARTKGLLGSIILDLQSDIDGAEDYPETPPLEVEQ